jgi:MOSC domain-containing protein YiiM
MDSAPEKAIPGRVCSLHLHPEQPGAVMRSVTAFEVVAQRGVQGDARYFDRPRSSGGPSLRHVSLMEREQIAGHARTLGLDGIAPGAVRANIETEGVNLVALLGRRVRIGNAILLLYEARKPCAKMDAICQGLRSLMEQNRQGVLAQVIQSGRISEGDGIVVAPGPE